MIFKEMNGIIDELIKDIETYSNIGVCLTLGLIGVFLCV